VCKSLQGLDYIAATEAKLLMTCVLLWCALKSVDQYPGSPKTNGKIHWNRDKIWSPTTR
jgi:hypothetical protein